MNARTTGNSLVLASVLAIFSYVPFELVAKGSLLFSAVLFVLDPIPPVTRLISLVSLVVVAILSRWHREWHKFHETNAEGAIVIEEEHQGRGEKVENESSEGGEGSLETKKAR